MAGITISKSWTVGGEAPAFTRGVICVGSILWTLAVPGLAQTAPKSAPSPTAPSIPPLAAPDAAAQGQATGPASPPQFQPNGEWEKLPRMQLERQFGGPLRDTIIQRLRDPTDGTICYLYLPITAPHSSVQSGGFVQYGGNIIGSINCLPSQATRASAPAASAPRPAKRAAPAAATSPANPQANPAAIAAPDPAERKQ